MENSMKRLLIGAAMASLLAAASITATAASAIVENAKDQCIVGEQADGYLGFVPGADVSDALRREVRDINQQRKSYYADLASRNGVSTDVTAALAAEKLIDKATSGQCVRDQNGRWVEL